MNQFMDKEGYEKLWGWFELSYASWLTIPRVLMHQMSDEWQNKMADLLQEYNDTWNFDPINLDIQIRFSRNGRLCKGPNWLHNYRHPNMNAIKQIKVKK